MAGRLSATMVVDINDRTGGKTKAIIGNLNRLERAERNLELANRGGKLSARDRAMEQMMIERERSIEDRQRSINRWVSGGVLAAGVGVTMAAKAYQNFADLERRVNRIVINADKGAETIRPTIGMLQKVADDAHMGFDEVVSGFETLIASGRTLEESLSFLPSIAITAQASGAAMSDIGLSADALAGSMKIQSSEMQKAFDILVAGGKAGKFELKDMAQYLPSLLPAFSALGYEGTEGLQKIVSMLQIVRNQAGSSGEAATYLSNVFNKMYSEDVSKRFQKFGVNLPKALAKAKKEGKDVLDVFLDMTQVALKGDMEKITLLFGDAEMQKGVRALISQRQALEEMNRSLKNVDGTALKDFNKIAEDSAAKIQQLSNLWGKFTTQVGSGVATVVNPVLEAVTQGIDDVAAASRGNQGMDEEQRNWQRKDFDKRFRDQNPEAWFWEVNEAYDQALRKVGRGQAKTVFDGLDNEDIKRRAIEQTSKYPSRGKYDPSKEPKPRVVKAPQPSAPVPIWKPGSPLEKEASRASAERDQEDGRRRMERYPGRGSYDPEAQDSSDRWMRQDRRRRLRAADPASLGMEGMGGVEIEKSRQDGDRSEATPSPGTGVPQQVTLSGTPAVALSGPVTLAGTPTVTITNPPPRPNISVNMSVTINEAQNADQVARQLRQRLHDEMQGLQADTNYAAGL